MNGLSLRSVVLQNQHPVTLWLPYVDISGNGVRIGRLDKVKKRGGRIYRTATDGECRRHEAIRAKIADELPETKERGQAKLALLKKEGTPLRQVVAALRIERERHGLSLADLNERTGMDRGALSRSEYDEEANPTLNTLERYADAVGKQMMVLQSEPSTS